MIWMWDVCYLLSWIRWLSSSWLLRTICIYLVCRFPAGSLSQCMMDAGFHEVLSTLSGHDDEQVRKLASEISLWTFLWFYLLNGCFVCHVLQLVSFCLCGASGVAVMCRFVCMSMTSQLGALLRHQAVAEELVGHPAVSWKHQWGIKLSLRN